MRVLVLGRHGRVTLRVDPPLAGSVMAMRLPLSGAIARAPRAFEADRNVRTELRRLYRTRQIPRGEYQADLASFDSALRAVKHLGGTRAAELEAVIENLHQIAAEGALTPSRLPVLFSILDHNRQWWTGGPLLSPRQIVGFKGSEVDWEYYPGQGLQPQPLASFGKADWFFTNGSRYYSRGKQLLTELIPLGAQRSGGLVWEYYFAFDGGTPPWTSAMSQGTALQALADGYKATGNAAYLDVARRALPVFRHSPPAGVSIRTRLGLRFVQYTFDPGRRDEIINAFLQTLIGLGDYAKVSQNPVAQSLFAAGNDEAQAELPSYDTGSWSLYQPGVEDDLSYHQLVTGFLKQLCSMTSAHVYCDTAHRFALYLKTPPLLKLLTHRLKARVAGAVWFHVSKVSRVGITVIRDGQTRYLTSGDFSYGKHSFAVPSFAPPGRYEVRLDATDLAGNYAQMSGVLRVER